MVRAKEVNGEGPLVVFVLLKFLSGCLSMV
jgi:hypothetical protein